MNGSETCTKESAAATPRAQRHYTAVGDAIRNGDLLDGRFMIQETVCRGGMSTIFKAQDLQNDGLVVAIKVPDKEVESKPALFMRFKREEQIGLGLDHSSILKFIPVGEGKSRPYLVMEYLRGTMLFQKLRTTGSLPEAEALKMAATICDALKYLHEEGVVHRDLKPENIMLCEDGGLRLMDFGVARYEHARRLTFINGVPGTPQYMAPEQVNGRRGDARADLYSLGVILYQMLTGKIPFDSGDPAEVANARVTGDPVAPRKLNPAISPQAEEIVLRAMERDPDHRYPDAAAMKKDLENPAAVVVTGRCERLEESTPWKRGWRKARYIALWALLPVAAQLAGFLLLWRFLARH